MSYNANYTAGYAKANGGCLTGKRAAREYRTTYDISYQDRIDLRGSWTFGRALGRPFNTLLTLKYPSTGSSSDIDHPRYIVHKTRVYLRTIGIESHIIWSRHIGVGSGVEECMILLHLENERFDHFSKIAQRWKSVSTVEMVDYGATRKYNGSLHTVFDIMFRAVDRKTLHKNPDVLAEASDPIHRPRFFNSFKLAKKHRIAHKKATQQIEN